MLAGKGEGGHGTSPGNLYANRVRTADFLLVALLTRGDPQLAEVRLKPFGRFKDDACHSQAVGSLGVGGNVVNINGFFRADFGGAERFPIDERIGFADADGAGVRSGGEQSEKVEIRLHVGYVNWISVGKNTQAVAFSESFQEGNVLNELRIEGAFPNFRELFKGERAAEPFGNVPVPVTGRDAALLPVRPAGIFLQRRPDFFRGLRQVWSQAGHGAGYIHADQDSPDIKDNGAKPGRRHGLLPLGAGNWSRASGADEADNHGQNRHQDNYRNHVMDALPDVRDGVAQGIAPEDHCTDP